MDEVRDDEARLAAFHARTAKLAASPVLSARLDLADRIAAQAMRGGDFNFETHRIGGAFEDWGLYMRDIKRALDAGPDATSAEAIVPPPVPSDIAPELRPAVAHFAGLAGLTLPEGW
jgi:hypothetical protein